MLQRLWNDEAGVLISAELCLIMTVAVLAIIVGLSEVAVAINTELNDVSNAFGALDQSFGFSGLTAADHRKLKGYIAGSSFKDRIDDCDRNDSCDLVCGPPNHPSRG